MARQNRTDLSSSSSDRVDLVCVRELPASEIASLDTLDLLFPHLPVVDEVDSAVNLALSNQARSGPKNCGVEASEHGIMPDRMTDCVFVGSVECLYPLYVVPYHVPDPYKERKVVLLREKKERSGESSDCGEQKLIELVCMGKYATNLDQVLRVHDTLAVVRPVVTKRRLRGREAEGVRRGEESECELLVGGMVAEEEEGGGERSKLVVLRSTATVGQDITGTSRKRRNCDSISGSSSGAASSTSDRSPSPVATHAVNSAPAANSPRIAPTSIRGRNEAQNSPFLPAPSATPSAVSAYQAKFTTARTLVPSLPTTAPSSSSAASAATELIPAPLRKKLIYTRLKDCTSTSKGVMYNVWAICTDVSKLPGPTRGKMLMSQVFIRDQSWEGTSDRPDYQFSLMAKNMEDFPPIAVGCVLRIHHMCVQEWKGWKTGRVYNAQSVAVINGCAAADPIKPVFTSRQDAFSFTAEDEVKVREMRRWWDKDRVRLNETAATARSCIKFCEVKPSVAFEVYCKVLRSFPRSEGQDVTVLRVTDGTRPSLNAQRHNGNAAIGGGALDSSLVVDVFVYGRSKWLDEVKEDGCCLLQGVRGVQMSSTGSLSVYKFIMEEESAACEVISSYHSAARELKATLENGGPPESQVDLDLEELLARIHESPPPASSANMFPDSELFNDIVMNGDEKEEEGRSASNHSNDEVDNSDDDKGENDMSSLSPTPKVRRLEKSSSELSHHSARPCPLSSTPKQTGCPKFTQDSSRNYSYKSPVPATLDESVRVVEDPSRSARGELKPPGDTSMASEELPSVKIYNVNCASLRLVGTESSTDFSEDEQNKTYNSEKTIEDTTFATCPSSPEVFSTCPQH